VTCQTTRSHAGHTVQMSERQMSERQMSESEVSLATTPPPPYVAVIFTSRRTPGDHGYSDMTVSMLALAREQPGYLGVESVRDDDLGITVSYWSDEGAAGSWKAVAEHLVAQERGRDLWYSEYRVRLATVTGEYGSSQPTA
jgi:heme-degrading monooxygenase HmoA